MERKRRFLCGARQSWCTPENGAAGFERWHAGIRSGLRAMRDRGHLASDADPDNLALATLAAIQGGLLLGQVQRTTQLKIGRSRFDPAPDRPSNAIDFLPLTSMDSGNERVFVHYKRMQNLPKKVWVQLF